MKRRVSLILYLSMALLLLACSGDESPSSMASSGASAVVETPEPTQGPLPIELTREPVRWASTPVLDLASATELQQPFDEVLRQNQQPPATPPVWRLHVVDGNSAPLEVLSTPRMLTNIEWQTGRSLRVDFQTVKTLGAPALGGAVAFRWQGEWRYDLNSKSSSEQLTTMPTDLAFDVRPSNIAVPRPSMQLDQTRQQALLTLVRMRPPPMPYELTDVFIVDARGGQRRLEGISGLRNVSWVPNGKAIVGTRGGGPIGDPFELLLIPIEDGDAIVVHNATRFVVQFAVEPAQTSGRVAFVSRGSGASHLSIYDAATRRIRVVSAVTESPMMTWPGGSERLVLGDQMIDLATGAVQSGSPADLYPTRQQENASPSGRLVAALAEPQQVPRTPCPGYPYRLSVTDKQTGVTRTLLECPAGTSGGVQWLSESRLVGGFASCWSCDAPGSRIWLFDLDRASAQSLTPGLETWAFVTPSPDKTRLLVGGDRLRLYSVDGNLLRDYGPPPEGFIFSGAAWSPDGSAFSYILRPESYPIGP